MRHRPMAGLAVWYVYVLNSLRNCYFKLLPVYKVQEFIPLHSFNIAGFLLQADLMECK